MRYPWTETEDAKLRNGMLTDDFQREHPHRTAVAIRQRRVVLDLPTEAQLRTAQLTDVPTPPPPEELDLSEVLEMIPEDPDEITGAMAVEIMRTMQQIADKARSTSSVRDKATYEFPDMLPIGLFHLGDIHTGNGGSNWSAFEQDIDTICATDGLYGIGMGDYVEGVNANMPKIGTALHALGSVADRGWQHRAVAEVLSRAKGKWLALLEGNHDAWSERGAVYNFTRDLARTVGAPFFREAGGTIYIRVGAVNYVIAVAHDYQGKSRINPSNKQRRMWQEWGVWENPDVVCTGHTHENLVHKQPAKGEDPVFLNSGTYKEHDTYATDKKFRPQRGIPMVILYPDRRDVFPVYGGDFEKGLRFLEAEREFYRQGAA